MEGRQARGAGAATRLKAKLKARDLIILDFHDFLVFLESLDVVY